MRFSNCNPISNSFHLCTVNNEDQEDTHNTFASPLLVEKDDGRLVIKFRVALKVSISPNFRFTLLGISSYPQINPFQALITRLTSSVTEWIYNEAEIEKRGE